MKHFTCIALTTALLAATPATANEDSLARRAAISLTASLSGFIAAQGNAALNEIRNEVKKDLLERFQLYLPQSDDIARDPPRTDAPLVQ